MLNLNLLAIAEASSKSFNWSSLILIFILLINFAVNLTLSREQTDGKRSIFCLCTAVLMFAWGINQIIATRGVYFGFYKLLSILEIILVFGIGCIMIIRNGSLLSLACLGWLFIIIIKFIIETVNYVRLGVPFMAYLNIILVYLSFALVCLYSILKQMGLSGIVRKIWHIPGLLYFVRYIVLFFIGNANTLPLTILTVGIETMALLFLGRQINELE